MAVSSATLSGVGSALIGLKLFFVDDSPLFLLKSDLKFRFPALKGLFLVVGFAVEGDVTGVISLTFWLLFSALSSTVAAAAVGWEDGKDLGLKGKERDPDLPRMGKLGNVRLSRAGRAEKGVGSSLEPIKILLDCVDVTKTWPLGERNFLGPRSMSFPILLKEGRGLATNTPDSLSKAEPGLEKSPK